MPPPSQTHSDTRPNILFIMPDQHRGDCLSLERHPAVMTPNIDAIGGGGTHFRRAYSTCPSCIPARRALLTGLHPPRNGMVGMTEGHPITTTTFPRELRDAGYQTALIGRWMHQYPKTARYGYDQMIYGSTHIEDEYFEDLEMQMPGAGGVKGLGVSFNGHAARAWPHADHLHPTRWVVSQARKFLKTHDETAPLFLTVSFFAPHPPLIPPAFYFERYLRMDLPPPAIGSWAKPPSNDGVGLDVESHRVHLKGETLRSAQAGYFGLINHIDDQLYWLNREFTADSRRHGREWVIVYTTDHGEMLGDHYLFRKCEPYEGSARIPFLIQGSPGLGLKSGHTCESPVCLEDLMPTFLDLAGQKSPEGIDGRSLVPILRGEKTSVRDDLHGEHATQYAASQANHYLTDGRMKYIWRPLDGSEQLFDLENDPHELANLAGDSKHAQATSLWRGRLIERLKNRPEGFVQGNQLVAGRECPKFIGKPSD